ncbi:MAG: response regulator, partial [Gemmataceae bacterium]|nr:response regulator [Gemmataceae bacterium]
VLSVHSKERRAFSQDDVNFLQGVANVVAAAIERKRAEEAQARLVALLEATPDIVAIAAEDGRLTYLNRAGRALVGLPSGADVSSRSLAALCPAMEGVPALDQRRRAAAAKGVWSGEAPLAGRARQRVPASQVLLWHGPDGGAPSYSLIARDLTERQGLEEQIRQSQKMEAVGKLAGGIAHDFNNLLTVINGYMAILVERTAADAPMRGQMEEVRKAGERAATLTRQLLAFSRKQMLAPQPVDLNALVADMDKMLRRLIGEDIRLSADLAPSLRTVKADPGQLEQVVVNLAVNARDAMPQGGRLALSTSDVFLDAEAVKATPEVRPGPYVLLSVSDTGCGMPPEVAARAFEPFFTTKPVGKGTGLGLSTVYGIVKQSGGHIEIDSSPGAGTTFRVYLPPLEQAAEAPAPVIVPTVRGGKETVLVVEDEEGVRRLAREILRQKGYTVLEACDGIQALAACDRHPGRIDLVLTDAVMPNMGGGTLARKLRVLRPEAKILFMSGFTDSALIRHGVASGEVDCLLKPFGPDGLAKAVRAVLDGEPLAERPHARS